MNITTRVIVACVVAVGVIGFFKAATDYINSSLKLSVVYTRAQRWISSHAIRISSGQYPK